LLRKRLFSQRQARIKLTPWIVALQAICRAIIIRRRWHTSLYRIKTSVTYVIKVQAQIRGILQRRRFVRLKATLRKFHFPIMRFQAVARAHLTRRARAELSESFFRPDVKLSIISFQSVARGALARRQASLRFRILKQCGSTFTALQAHCRGILVRRRMRAQVAKLENVSHVVVRIQAAVRTYLARKRLLLLIRGLRKATPIVVGLQARARASLKRQQHQSINKALAEVQSVISVGNLQALARASLVRNKHRQMNKKLTVALPDIVGFQATARAWLLRRDFCAWRDHLLRSQMVATILQAMLRGTLQRRAFRAKMEYYSANLSKVVIIQSLFRAKETREQYRQLTLGKNVTVGTIKNFVHLLDDSEADFQEEIKVERLRKRVVEHIRENQALENEVNDLEVKIALIVQNVKSFDELIKARKRHGADSAAAHAARVSLLAAYGDPFSGPNTLDQDARRKLELYQQLFYLLQTRGEYLSKLFVRLSVETCSETSRRFIERVVLTLFGYGQDRREDFLLLKLFQASTPRCNLFRNLLSQHPAYY
jgi:Ras GTPase-activating-like protein IQGAP2/3